MSGGSVPFAIPWRRSLRRAKVPAEDPSDLAQLIYQQYPVVCGTKRDADVSFRKVAENLKPISPEILSQNANAYVRI
jgi:hypothetical protein